ncbi:hypothetical protein [Corynebacterium macclintockiae]|uniref:hypothetical protein n=1 Tax=Corynebacterium macclintockiae TaxID=2913501 RepID=UPI003EBA1D4A
MTSNQQQLAKLEQHAKELAEQIKQLQDQLNNAQPTTGLLGRWAKHPEHGDVLIAEDWVTDANAIYVIHRNNNGDNGAQGHFADLDDLEFPDQTTRPQDVPVGEAWLVDADDGDYSTTNTPALKIDEGLWTSRGLSEWTDEEVELITPLIPARPQDTPETVTTQEEYGELPEGSIVAKPGENPWVHLPYMWVRDGNTRDNAGMAGTARQVLRHGWGTSPDNS